MTNFSQIFVVLAHSIMDDISHEHLGLPIDANLAICDTRESMRRHQRSCVFANSSTYKVATAPRTA